MSEVAEKAAEVAAEVTEEAVDGVVEVVEVFRNNPAAIAAALVGGVLVGATAGYFIAKKSLESLYADVASQEIAEAKEYYAGLNRMSVDGEPLTPGDVLEQRHGPGAAAAAMREYQGMDLVDPSEEGAGAANPYERKQDDDQADRIVNRTFKTVTEVVEEKEVPAHEGDKPIQRNVFVDGDFDLEEEMKHRTKAKPYIITHEEFHAGELNYEQARLSYFAGDDTLVDERDDPMQAVDAIVGDEHLVRFGSGSGDRNIVFIRNDRLGIDYEITKSEGSYAVEVLGIPEEPGEIKHSADLAAKRAFRRGDE